MPGCWDLHVQHTRSFSKPYKFSVCLRGGSVVTGQNIQLCPCRCGYGTLGNDFYTIAYLQFHFFALPGRSFFAIFYIECIVFAVAAFKPQPSHVFFWPRSNPNFPMCPFGLDRTPVVPQIRTPTFPCVLCRLYIYTPTNVYIWTRREYITASYTLISLNPNLNPYPCRFQSPFILYLLHNPYPNTF